MVISLLLILTGVAHIVKGSVGWTNYWGGLVFPPVALLFGALLLYITLFRWKKFLSPREDANEKAPGTFKDDWKKW
jgi:hypothetical protein